MSSNITTLSAKQKGKGSPSGAFLTKLSRMFSSRLRKSALGLAHEKMNPLWNISARYAQLIYDYARSGNFAQIQYLYNEIEERDPTLNVCVTRRCSAVAELDWSVVRSDQRKNRKVDQSLVDEQIACLEESMAKIDNLPDAMEHLGLASFRGFSMVSPLHDFNGDINHLELVDGWNLCYDYAGQSWLFNPDASSFMTPTLEMAKNGTSHLQPIPKEQMCVVTRKRQIDFPAMQIYLRMAIGERDWGRFLETYGLPPVIITMPEFTSKDDEAAYLEAAESVFEGRSGVVPHDSQVNYASESRGTDPFSAFIEHQQKLVVLMATGGTLTSLAESGSGTLGGNAQMDVWKQIVRADVRLISNAVNKQICEGILKAKFKGKPLLAEWQLDTTPKPEPKDVLDLASTASSAGFEMDAEELSRATGFTIRKKVESAGFNAESPHPVEPDPNGGPLIIPDDNGDIADAEPTVVENTDAGAEAGDESEVDNLRKRIAELEAQLSQRGDSAENAQQRPVVASAQVKTDNEPSAAQSAEKRAVGDELVASLQSDFKGVADRIAEVLAIPEAERPEAAQKLMGELDQLVPDDPAMAEVIAEQMQAAFDRQITAQPQGNAPAANKAIPNSQTALSNESIYLFLNAKDDDIEFRNFNGSPHPIDPKTGEIKGNPEVAREITESKTKKPLKQRCIDAKRRYDLATDHASLKSVLDGSISIDRALEKGFEAKLAGYQLTFYTQDILGSHYTDTGRSGRLNLIKHMLENRNKMQYKGKSSGKMVFYPDTNVTDDGRKLVCVVDEQTKMAIAVHKMDDATIKRDYGSWKKHR